MKETKIISVLVALMLTVVFAVSYSQAATLTSNPTTIYSDTNTLTSATLNPIETQEVGNNSITSGYFTVKIPADVKLSQTGSATATPALGASAAEGDLLTRSTTVLGTSASPKSLYILGAGDSGIVGWRSGNSWFGILKVYTTPTGTTAAYSTSAYTQRTNTVAVGDWATAGTKVTMPSSAASSTKIGEIYFDDTTNETVISLTGISSSTTASEKLTLQDISVIPATAKSTGDVNFKILNGNASGGGLMGISDDTAVKVMTMVDQAVNVAGTATGTSLPVLKAGAVAAQPQGVVTITKVGAITATTADKLIFTLDNGAVFHNDAATNANINWSNGLTNTETISAGTLVYTLAAGALTDTATLTIPVSTATIDVSAATAGTITATITGEGQLVTVNKTVALATVAVGGTVASFVDNTTAGPGKRFAGRNGQAFPGAASEYILVGETAPGSLLAGGLFTMTLDSGAYFQTSTQVTIVDTAYTTSPYTNAALDLAADAATAKSASKSVSVTTASSSTLGGLKITAATLDLRSATPGTLMMTLSGTSGATGTVTVCDIINATSTVTGTTDTIVPGATITLPDITITEGLYGALSTSGYIGLHFPTGVTLSTTAVPTVTTTPATTGTASTTTVTGSVAANDLMLDVTSASTSASGAYTIVISGLQATIANTVSSGDLNFVIGGSTTSTYSAAAFGSNFGAMPTQQTVKFGTLVSATVPFVDTAVVSGTAITQTFIPAGNDIGKVGDVYVFTTGQYWTGSAWTATETPYSAGATLGSMTVTYNVGTFTANADIYIGYGVGLTGTNANMNTNATFVKAYTFTYVPPTIPTTGTAAGATTVSQALNDDIGLYLNITNDDGVSAPAQEWLVFGAIVGNVDAGLFFFTPAGDVVAFEAGLDLSTVTYAFDHTSDTLNVATLNMGTLGLAAGDTFWYAYVYAATAIDLADPTSYSVENSVIITAQ